MFPPSLPGERWGVGVPGTFYLVWAGFQHDGPCLWSHGAPGWSQALKLQLVKPRAFLLPQQLLAPNSDPPASSDSRSLLVRPPWQARGCQRHVQIAWDLQKA